MSNDMELKYKEEIASLKQRLFNLEDEFTEVLKYADTAIVETRADMRIINSNGAIDLIFAEGLKYFERGESLLTVIYKTTHNTRPSMENVYQNSDEIDTIEQTINKFIEGTLEEKTIRIVGEKENGELFLLLWTIKRKEKTYRSFFRIIPTNSIIQSSQSKHKFEIENMNKLVRDTMNLIEEGVISLNLKNEIRYMNSSAKRFFFTENSGLLKNAPVEGRYFHEVLVNETSDDVRLRLDEISKCIGTKKPTSYSLKKREMEYLFRVFPQFNEKKELIGTITIIRDDSNIFSSNPNPKQEMEKLSKALKHYSSIAKSSEARLAELENNQKWLMNQNNEYQSALKSVYAFLDNLPAPVAILSLPARKYEFVNIAFLKKVNKSKESVKGKTDDDIFTSEDADVFATKNQEAIETLDQVKVSTPNFYAKQIAMVNMNNKPTHILRVFS